MSQTLTPLVYPVDHEALVEAAAQLHAQHVSETSNPEGFTVEHFQTALFLRLDSLIADLLTEMPAQVNEASQWGPLYHRLLAAKGGDR